MKEGLVMTKHDRSQTNREDLETAGVQPGSNSARSTDSRASRLFS